MAAKIKLKRIGTRKKPVYKIVVIDESAATKSSAVDVLGNYNPRVQPTLINFNKEKTEKWLKIGATPTDKVRILLGKAGILPPVDFSKMVKRQPKAAAAKSTEGAAEASPAPTAEAAV